MKRIALFLLVGILISVLILGCGQHVVEEEPKEVIQEQEVKEDTITELEPLSPSVKVTVGMKEVVSTQDTHRNGQRLLRGARY